MAHSCLKSKGFDSPRYILVEYKVMDWQSKGSRKLLAKSSQELRVTDSDRTKSGTKPSVFQTSQRSGKWEKSWVQGKNPCWEQKVRPKPIREQERNKCRRQSWRRWDHTWWPQLLGDGAAVHQPSSPTTDLLHRWTCQLRKTTRYLLDAVSLDLGTWKWRQDRR